MGRLVFFTNRSNLGSARCRGTEIAERIGVPCDPPFSEVQPDDTIVMVKKVYDEAVRRAKNFYCDVVDGMDFQADWNKLKVNGRIKVLTMTPESAAYAKKTFVPKHECGWTPHTHPNNENIVRPLNREVKRIIYNGTDAGFPKHYWNEFAEKAKAQGFEALRNHTIPIRNDRSSNRQRCCDMYLDSDIVVAFRRDLKVNPLFHMEMKSTTKLNTAASFCIPFVAFPEPGFHANCGYESVYVPVNTIDEMVAACVRLREDREHYEDIAIRSWKIAQHFHIDEVVKHYLKLLED